MVLYRLGILLGAVVVLAGAGDAQLPPAMQMDLHAVEAERHIETGDYAAAKAALDRVLALQAAHDVALPEAFGSSTPRWRARPGSTRKRWSPSPAI